MNFWDIVIKVSNELYMLAPTVLVVCVCVKLACLDARIEELERKIKELESK